MTPEEALAAMRLLREESESRGADLESVHGRADWILCELARQHGYADAVAVYDDIEKWYA